MTKMRLNFSTDRIVSASAILIALASMIVTIWQGLEERKHNRLSVRPKLEISYAYQSGVGYYFSLENKGLGPANIINMTVYWDNEPIPETGVKAIDAITDSLQAYFTISYSAVESGMTIEADDELNLILFHETDLDSVQFNPGQIPSRVAFTIRYESMYNEPFVVSTIN